jgi:predicted enzyme related to lactoylglutathione lyase
MPRPVHFEIPAENPERVMAFYGSVFGWTFHKFEGGAMPYWLITTGPETEPGINGGILPQQYANQPCVNTTTVANVDESVAAVTANGGEIALPKMAVPGVGWLAYAKDPEGHVFGMMQPDPSAK